MAISPNVKPCLFNGLYHGAAEGPVKEVEVDRIGLCLVSKHGLYHVFGVYVFHGYRDVLKADVGERFVQFVDGHGAGYT